MERDLTLIKKMIYLRFIMGLIVVAILLFVPAGSLDYWEGWVYYGIVFVPMFFVLRYFLKHDHELLERRMKMREKEGEQKKIIALASILFLIGFIVPGLDYRFGWSDVPVGVVLLANGIVVICYLVFFLTLRENRYASRVIEVEKGQTVITSGPYALVRHPMYLGIMLMFLCTPLALGSYWALIAFLPILPILVLRILNEEKILTRDLPGYTDYCKLTRYRLLPFIW
ncbi:MAG: isoprenylcysteine carboxylmethyltransferase family protein [Methanomicrobiales archaeon]|nr:isoprenylcysteine carboxylmethyltransferase family protein [Methanomicrobiales archaeon]